MMKLERAKLVEKLGLGIRDDKAELVRSVEEETSIVSVAEVVE